MRAARDVITERGIDLAPTSSRQTRKPDMRAVTITRFGAADVLTLEDVPVPGPGPDQVAIDVSHAAVGLADVAAAGPDPE
jgi:hypothetical protein